MTPMGRPAPNPPCLRMDLRSIVAQKVTEVPTGEANATVWVAEGSGHAFTTCRAVPPGRTTVVAMAGDRARFDPATGFGA